MHEWALAEGVYASALKAIEREGLDRVTRIVVAVGELQQIERDIFREALEQMRPADEQRLTDVRVDLQTEAAAFTCRACGSEFTLSAVGANLSEEESEAIHFIPELAHTYLKCPGCGSPDFDVSKGRGVWIVSVEGSA